MTNGSLTTNITKASIMQNARDSLQSEVLILQAMVQHCVELPVDAHELRSFAKVIRRFTSYGAISCEDFLQETFLKILQDEKKFPTDEKKFPTVKKLFSPCLCSVGRSFSAQLRDKS